MAESRLVRHARCMKTSRLAIAAVTSLLALTLAGCTGGGTPAPSETPSATASGTPGPSPSVTPEPSEAPEVLADALECPSWDDGLDESGLEPIAGNRYAGICVGMSFEEASGTFAGPPLMGTEYCPWITEIVAMPDPGLYVEAISSPEAPGDRIFMFRMTWLGDPMAAPAYERPFTVEGASVGTGAAQVLSLYPTATQIVREDMAAGTREQIVVRVTADLSYVFDVTGGLVNTVYWGEGLEDGAQAELCAL